jgi:hypothetical protein
MQSLFSAQGRCEWSASWRLPLCAGEGSKLEAWCATYSVQAISGKTDVTDLSLHWDCNLWNIGPIVSALRWPVRIVSRCRYVGMKKNWAGQIPWWRPLYRVACVNVISWLARFYHTYTFFLLLLFMASQQCVTVKNMLAWSALCCVHGN